MATRVRYEAIIKAIVFIPQAIAAMALGVIWRFVYFPKPNTGLLNALLGVVGIGPVSWLGSQTLGQRRAHHRRHLGIGRIRDRHPVGGPEGHQHRDPRGGPRGRRHRSADLLRRIIVPMLSLPISVVAVTLVINVIKLFDLIYTMTQGGPANSSRVIAFSMYQEALPGPELRLRRGDRGDHAASSSSR